MADLPLGFASRTEILRAADEVRSSLEPGQYIDTGTLTDRVLAMYDFTRLSPAAFRSKWWYVLAVLQDYGREVMRDG